MNRSEEDLCLSAPGFDIRGIQHEKLYSGYMSRNSLNLVECFQAQAWIETESCV